MRFGSRLLGLFLLLGTPSCAQPGSPPPDLPALVESADMIVVGGPTRSLAPPDGPPVSELSVSRVLKGRLSAHSLRVNGVFYRSLILSADAPRLYFLHAEADGSFSVTDRSLAASSLRPDGAAQTTDPLATVVAELIRVLATPPDSFVAANPDLRSRLGSTVMEPDETESPFFGPVDGQAARAKVTVTAAMVTGEIYLTATEALDSVPLERLQPAINAALGQNLSTTNRLGLINYLISRGDFSHVEDLKPILLDAHDKLRASVPCFRGAVQTGYDAAPSRDLVPVLTDFLSSRSVSVRRIAASVLWQAPDNQGLRPLAEIALGDPDIDVRFSAETGLCALVREQHPLCDQRRQGSRPTRGDEAALHTYWTDWASANLAKKM